MSGTAWMALKAAGTALLKKIWEQRKQNLNEQERQESWRRVEGLLLEIGCDPSLSGPIPEIDPQTEDILKSMFLDLLATQGVKTTQAMTKLLAHYVSNGKSLDKFFRRTGKLLVQIDDEDLDLMRELLQRCQAIRVQDLPVAALVLGHDALRLYRYSGAQTYEETVPFTFSRDLLDVFRLLKESGFVLEPPGGAGDDIPCGPGALLITAAAWVDIERLISFL